MANLTIQLSQELLKSLRGGKSVTLSLDAPAKGARRPGRRNKAKKQTARKTTGAARAGGRKKKTRRGRKGGAPLHQRVLHWAKERGSEFGASDIVSHLKVTRNHAGMLLARLIKDKSIKRTGRGVYKA